MLQPVSPPVEVVGVAQRWTRLDPAFPDHESIPAADVAAAFLDDDDMEGNGSRAADRAVLNSSSLVPVPFLGTTASPILETTVKMNSAISPHSIQLKVKLLDHVVSGVSSGCMDQVYSVNSQIEYKVTDPGRFAFEPGDSGGPVFNVSGQLIGMLNVCYRTVIPGPPPQVVCVDEGTGTHAQAIKDSLNFEKWYGTSSVQDQTVGIFRSGDGKWVLDKGDNVETTCGAGVDQDLCYSLLGIGGVPVTGEWDGNGTLKMGAFSGGTWVLDYNGNGIWDGCLPGEQDRCIYMFGEGPGQRPVVGNWNGSTDKKAKLGFYNATNGTWILDYNGSYSFTNCTDDRCYSGWDTGVQPVAGDWSGSGTAKIGTFATATGNWRLDYDGNGQKNCPTDRCYDGFGAGTQGIVADWNGTGTTRTAKIAQFTSPAGNWILDMNGNGTFDSCSLDNCIIGQFGKQSGDQPVAWNKSEVKAN